MSAAPEAGVPVPTGATCTFCGAGVFSDGSAHHSAECVDTEGGTKPSPRAARAALVEERLAILRYERHGTTFFEGRPGATVSALDPRKRIEDLEALVEETGNSIRNFLAMTKGGMTFADLIRAGDILRAALSKLEVGR